MPFSPFSSPPSSSAWYRQPFLLLILGLLSFGVVMASSTLFFALSYPDPVVERVETPATKQAGSYQSPS